MIDEQLLANYNQSRNTTDISLICHAPFVSLNFEQNGNVTACCYNRTFVLGTYPHNSVNEIWSGSKADELRNHIKNNDLGHGCKLCLRQLTSGNFLGMRARGYDAYAQPKHEYFNPNILRPSVFEFELSNTCNLECVMCNGHFSSSIRKNREKLPPKANPYDTDFVDQLKAFMPSLKVAKFLGGEPFLIDMYYDIWDRMIQTNPKIKLQITTNGTILNNKVKDTLEILESDLIISIDSIVKETYESIRKNASYERVMENLEYFIDYSQRKGTQLYFAVCPIYTNWHEMPALVEYCTQRGIGIFFNTVITPVEKSLKSFWKDELIAVEEQYQTALSSYDLEIQSLNTEAFIGLLNQVTLWREEAEYHQDLNTKEVKHILTILQEIFAAHEKPEVIMNIKKAAPQPVSDQVMITSLKKVVSAFKEKQVQIFEIPALIRHLIGFNRIKYKIKHNLHHSIDPDKYYTKGLKNYTKQVRRSLHRQDQRIDISELITAFKLFYPTLPSSQRSEENMDEKFDAMKLWVEGLKNTEVSYYKVTSKDPEDLFHEVEQLSIDQLTNYLSENFL